MERIKTFLDCSGRACQEKTQALFRIALVCCLGGILVLGLPTQQREAIPESPQAYNSGLEGIGGGGYIEKTISEELIGAALSLESGILEPEYFSKPRILLYSTYSVQRGDIIGELAVNFGLNEDTLISVNRITNTRLIQIGQLLHIPNQDGILYTVRQGDSLDSIAQRYRSDSEAIKYTNELFSQVVLPGSNLFIPGARLDWIERQEINGDLFIWPASGRITSPYGWRRSPFGNARQFHSGIDIAASAGSPVRAAMSGRVSAVGWDNIMGNYIVVNHHSGYRTMYGHLSSANVRSGAYVGTGERIGSVGSTGLSTGPHLHFTVYKNGVTVNPRSLMR